MPPLSVLLIVSPNSFVTTAHTDFFVLMRITRRFLYPFDMNTDLFVTMMYTAVLTLMINTFRLFYRCYTRPGSSFNQYHQRVLLVGT